MLFSYPEELARQLAAEAAHGTFDDGLDKAREQLIEIAYQASMARDELREVRIRIVVAKADKNHDYDDVDGPHVLRLTRSRRCTVEELRRLAAATPFETALVCVGPCDGEQLRIWGIAWTGAQWLAPTWGGRSQARLEGRSLIVHVNGPGRIALYAGGRFLAALERGAVVTRATDVFTSAWMPQIFASARAEITRGDTPLDDNVVRFISQHMIRRSLWLMRAGRHGGMLLFAEPANIPALLDGPLRPKYAFRDDPARARYRDLLRRVTRTAGINREDALEGIEAPVFELSRLIASFSAVDGAVLLTKRFDVIGFGVEILSGTSSPARIRRALDTEGEICVDDEEENVGTRHRAAYRFIQHQPDGLAIVVSQDGSVRFVTSLGGDVVYFEQHLVG